MPKTALILGLCTHDYLTLGDNEIFHSRPPTSRCRWEPTAARSAGFVLRKGELVRACLRFSDSALLTFFLPSGDKVTLFGTATEHRQGLLPLAGFGSADAPASVGSYSPFSRNLWGRGIPTRALCPLRWVHWERWPRVSRLINALSTRYPVGHAVLVLLSTETGASALSKAKKTASRSGGSAPPIS